MIKGQDEVFKNKTGLNGEFDVKAWQKDNSSYKKRINNEYAQAIKSIDELNNGSIRLSKEDLAKIEEFKNNNFLEQDIKTNISSFLEDAIDKDLSAEQIFNLRSAINKQLATGNKTYNTKEAYRLVKDTLDETMIKNASDKELAKKILEDANKNYALKENFNNSYLGKIKDQETPEALAQRIANGARNINEDKDLKRAFEGMNEAERKANEKHAFNALLAKHRIEDIGYDFKNLAKDMDNVEFVSKDLKYAKEVVNVYAKIYQNNKDLIMTALASSGKKTNSSIATTIQGVFDRILISGVFARIHALVPFMKSAKEQALRNQILDALKLAKTNKEVISNLKNIKIADQEQSRIFKDALDNYIKVDKEQNKILKDALIKEGVIKGDNFFMDKADPKDNSLRFIGKNGKEYTINKDVRNEWMKTFNLKNIDDEYIPNIPKEAKIALKDREIKLTKGSLLKLIEKDRIKYIPHIKETLENPQLVLRDKDDFVFIKNIDNQTYFTSIGKDYETHLTIISNSPKKQNNIKNKMKNAEVVYYNNARALPTSRASSETKQVSFSNENSTQTKPKTNLMDDIKENIKAKEVKKKNKKSVKQRLDEKIQNDKKASEDILKRYDNFLKENKDYNFDFLDNMNLNTVEYNLTRQMIINAKESTNKGVKKDIPSALRGKIEQELNIQPLKEFGENYAEYYHDGKGALQKLLIEKQGQVAGAFHRKDLGDIDLVWGDGNFGLSHIVNRREEDFIKQGLNKIEAKNKALNFIKEIENIINNGNVKKGNNRAFIDVKNSRVMVALDYKGKDKKWIITAYNFY